MTGAERGTAIHAFLQSVPFGPQPPELEAEVQRQLDLHLLDPELAKVLDLEQVRPFLPAGYGSALPLPARSCGKNRSLPRCRPEKSSPKRRGRGERPRPRVLVQGIADVVLVFDDHAEILDYKNR